MMLRLEIAVLGSQGVFFRKSGKTIFFIKLIAIGIPNGNFSNTKYINVK